MSDTTPQPPPTPPIDDGRRRLCKLAVGGMAVVSAGTVGYPIITFLKLPKSIRPEESVEIPLEELSADAAKWEEHAGRQIAIILVDGEPLAFDGACPHLGCVVLWDGATRMFKCPCHGAAFNDQGEPIAGPVNSPLKRVEFKVQDGVLKLT